MMLNDNQLYLIYSKQKDVLEDKSMFQVLSIFSTEGLLDLSSLEGEEENHIFFSYQHLVVFAKKILNEYNLSNIKLLSVEDYNLGLGQIQHRDEIISLFERFGEDLSSSQSSNTKTGGLPTVWDKILGKK